MWLKVVSPTVQVKRRQWELREGTIIILPRQEVVILNAAVFSPCTGLVTLLPINTPTAVHCNVLPADAPVKHVKVIRVG